MQFCDPASDWRAECSNALKNHMSLLDAQDVAALKAVIRAWDVNPHDLPVSERLRTHDIIDRVKAAQAERRRLAALTK